MRILIGLFGIVIGSFVNVVAYRLPRLESLATPPSRCTSCNTQIKYHDNIPVISWLLLRGRCRTCHSSISPRYLMVELSSGVLFEIVAGKFHLRSTIFLIAFLYLAAVTITLALIDLDTHTLPNKILFPSYGVGALFLGADGVLQRHSSGLIRALLGALVLGMFYLLLSLLYPGGMGMGDVKYAGLLGLFLGYLGWGELLVATFTAFLLGGLFAVALLMLRKGNIKSGIPFGPWMSMGAWVGIVLGTNILHHYYQFFGLANRV